MTATGAHSAGRKTDAPLGLLQIINYNLPAVGVGFMFFIVTLYLMKFSTDVLLISPAAMGLIFGLSRIWDALTDPVCGYLSDRTNTLFGRRRPWIGFSLLPIAVAFYMLWNPPFSLAGTALVLWMAAAVFLFYTATTVFVVPHTALGAELSLNYHERTKIFGYRHILWHSGSILSLAAMYLLIVSAAPRLTATQMSLVVLAITSGLILVMVLGARERPEYLGRGEKNPFTAFADVLRNPHARLLLLVFLIENIGGATLGVLTPYISQYIIGTPTLTPMYILLYLLPSVFSVPLWIRLSRHIGKKNVWLLSMILTGVSFGAMFLLGEGQVFFYSVLAVFAGLGSGSGAVVAPSIQSDIIDYDEYVSGKRKEGAYFAAWNFVYKSAIGITLMLAGFVLQFSGFEPNVEQTETAKLALQSLYSLFPLVCYLMGALLFTRFSLSEREHGRIRAELDRRREAA